MFGQMPSSLQLSLQCMVPTHNVAAAPRMSLLSSARTPVSCCITTHDAVLKQAFAAGCLAPPSCGPAGVSVCNVRSSAGCCVLQLSPQHLVRQHDPFQTRTYLLMHQWR